MTPPQDLPPEEAPEAASAPHGDPLADDIEASSPASAPDAGAPPAEEEREPEAAGDAPADALAPRRLRRPRVRRRTAEPVAEAEAPAAEAEAPAAEAQAPAAEAAQPAAETEAPAAPAPAPAARPPVTAPTRRRSRRDPNLPAPVVRAQARYVRSSARKARLVCDHIRGKSVEEARAILGLTPRAIASDWSKLLESAVANAEHNHELVGEDLYVKAVHADEGPTIKRFRPRARGRAAPIRKRTSHLTILLTPKN